MQGSTNRDGHVRLDLGAYVLGALSDVEDESVRQHLAWCDECRAEADRLSDVPAVFAQLSAADLAALRDEFAADLTGAFPAPDADPVGRPASTGPPDGGAAREIRPRRATRPAPRPRPGTATVRPGIGRTGTTQPTALDTARSQAATPGTADRTVPHRPPTSRRRGHLRLILAAVALALVVGVGVGAWLQSTVSPTPVTLAGSASDGSSGADATVTVKDHGDHCAVTATLRHLVPGTQYQLFAVRIDGQTDVVAQWIGSADSSTVIADVSTQAQQLAFFTVTTADGTVVLTVRLTGGS